jgi:hypothetical protein
MKSSLARAGIGHGSAPALYLAKRPGNNVASAGPDPGVHLDALG